VPAVHARQQPPLYADGHVAWAHPDEMGRNNGPFTNDPTSTHYSHADDSRPYLW
jgi:hypothetical protein